MDCIGILKMSSGAYVNDVDFQENYFWTNKSISIFDKTHQFVTPLLNPKHAPELKIDPENEERINHKKQKKRSKHFDGTINDVKIKFLNFRFKTYSSRFETVEVIEIISKLPFPDRERENSFIRLENERTIVEITGDWKGYLVAPGSHTVVYSIKKKTIQNKSEIT